MLIMATRHGAIIAQPAHPVQVGEGDDQLPSVGAKEQALLLLIHPQHLAGYGAVLAAGPVRLVFWVGAGDGCMLRQHVIVKAATSGFVPTHIHRYTCQGVYKVECRA